MQRSALRITLVVAAMASLATTLAACGPGEPKGPTSLGIGIEPGLFVGQYEVTPGMLTLVDPSAVYESLLFFDLESSSFEPFLAESYEFSDDRETATFVLRDDVQFSDGEHMDAEGVVASMAALVQKAIDDVAWGYEDYEVQFRATGEYELEITTAKPMAPRLIGNAFSAVAVMPIYSPAYVNDLEALTSSPVGTGPYLLEETVPQVSATFLRNPNYWNTDQEVFDTLKVTVFADPVAGLNALKSGQVDAVKIGVSAASDAQANGLKINQTSGSSIGLWIGDRFGSIQPALADLRVRQAIELAFDREAINESLNFGYGRVTSQPFVEGTPEYVEGGDDRYGYDPEAARELMAEAGYADGFDITIPSTSFLGISAWEPVVSQYLGDIGIRVTFESFPDAGAYFTAALSGNYPVMVYPATVIAMEVFFLPTAFFSFHDANSDPTVDELAATMALGSLEESNEAASEIGEYVLDQAWFAVIAGPNVLWAMSPDVDIVGQAGENPRVGQFSVAN
jgi:peptide/nickel transport system substrate-binding protein